MPKTMYDAVNASAIPANAEIVAGYVEGRYAWSAADWARFPNAVKVTIAIWNADADVLDIETGDATPAMGPAWVARQRARGAFPTVYCNTSTWPAVQSALSAAGFVNGTHYDWWAARYTGQPHLEPGSAATQYADPGPYDLSLCQDYWPRTGVPDLTNDEHNALMQLAAIAPLVRDIHDGMGSLVSIVPGQPQPLAFQIRDLLGAQQGRLDALKTALDPQAVAALLLPHLSQGSDPEAVANLVLQHIASALNPPKAA
jgi:hypothetical protein